MINYFILLNFDFNLFVDDLAKYCEKYYINFWEDEPYYQKFIIKSMLKEISKHFNCTCKDYKILKNKNSLHLRKKIKK